MNAKALVALFALIIAAAAAFFVLREDGAQLPAPHTANGGAAANPATAPADVVQGDLGAALAVAEDADAQRVAAPEAAMAPTNSSSVGIRGRLVDKNGAPRPGVELMLVTWPGFEEFDLDLPPPPPVRASDLPDVPKFTTRADGTFTFALSKDRGGFIEIEASELIFAKGSPRVNGKAGDRDLGDVVALRGGIVRGVVNDERGLPVADVKVTASLDAMGFGGSSTSTRADGSFSVGKLSAGKLTMRTASGKFLPTVQELELAAEEERADVVLVVRAGNAIAGQVVDDRGVGVAGMKVGGKRKETRGAMDIERFATDEATATDANGFFTLSGLADEPVSVRAFGPGHSSAFAADVPVGTGNLVLRVERFGVVEGVLQGADGKPIAGSRVAIDIGRGAEGPGDVMMIDHTDGALGPGGPGAVTAADGSFRLASVKPGIVTLAARGPTHRPVRHAGVDVRPAQTTSGVRLIADAGATARVEVRDGAGKPVADATVRAQAVREGGVHGLGELSFRARAVAIEDTGGGPVLIGGDRSHSAKTDAQGIAVLNGLPAADLELSATHADFAAAAPVRVTTPKAGTVEAKLTMREPGHALVMVTNVDGSPIPGADVEVLASGVHQAPLNAKAGVTGEARFGPLAPGEYTAKLRRENQPTRVGDAMFVMGAESSTIESSAQSFRVAAGETVRVALQRPQLTRVHGTVTGGGGPVAGCVIELEPVDRDGPGIPGFGDRSATAAADGAFAFDDVEPGSYRVRFGKQEQVVKATGDLVVPPNTPDLRHDLELRSGSLRVQVVSEATGEPIEKAQVEVERAADTASGEGPRRGPSLSFSMVTMVNDEGSGAPEVTSMTMGIERALTDANGFATIEDVPAGSYSLRITHKKHADTDHAGVVVVERQLTDCGRVAMSGAGQVAVKVLGADGKSVRMATVQHKKVGAEEWSTPTMAMNGSARLNGLAPGRHSLRATPIGAQGSNARSAEVEVDVKAGETTNAELQLPK